MNKRKLLDKYQIYPIRYKKKNNVDILSTDDNRYVLKKGNYHNIYEYLQTRNFKNIPCLINNNDDDYNLYQYIDDYSVPKEQRVEDFIYLLSILHNKTTFYKKIELDKIKEIFENLRSRQDYLSKYYQNLQDMIEIEKYMSPSHYQLIRNLSLIYFHLTESKNQIEKWYELTKNNKKMRYAMTHGNLKKDHFIENQDLYLISWEHARINSPVYDLENFYRNNWQDISLSSLLEIYQSKYLLTKEELHLFLALIHLPQKIEFSNSELENVRQIQNLITYHEHIENWKQKAPVKDKSPV